MNITMTRGDTPEYSFKLFDEDMQPMDLAGVTIWLTVKAAFDDDVTDAAALLKDYIVFNDSGTVTGSSGFTIGGIDPETSEAVTGRLSGVVTWVPTQAASTALPAGDHIYDVQVKLASGRFRTVYRGLPFVVEPDVTRRISTP